MYFTKIQAQAALLEIVRCKKYRRQYILCIVLRSIVFTICKIGGNAVTIEGNDSIILLVALYSPFLCILSS